MTRPLTPGGNWRGEPVDAAPAWRLALELSIRLRCSGNGSQPLDESSTVGPAAACDPTEASAVLTRMASVLLRKQCVDGRMTEWWRIHGAARIDGQPVEFLGEYERDHASGAFKNFNLDIVR